MSKVIVSSEAQKDLVSIQRYIREELCNPDEAQRIIAALKKSVLGLRKFPSRGRPLDALISAHTEYLYVDCENYCIFYLNGDNEVMVIRIIISGRTR